MIGSPRLLSIVAAGLVALFGAAGPAVAHDAAGPPRQAHPAAPAPTTGEPGPHASSGTHSLRELQGGARAMVVGRVQHTDTFDDAKLLVYRVGVEQVLRGPSLGPTASIVDLRAGLTRPPLLADGQRAVLVLVAAPSLSYLTQQLPGEGDLYQLADGRDGIIPVTTDADVDLILGLLEAEERVRTESDPEARAQALRQLAFRLLGTDQPRLVADGLLELRRLPPELSLTSEELSVLGRVLRDPAIPEPTRIGLIRLLGQRRWEGALAALQAVDVDRPDVLAALLQARANLGAPATQRDLAPYLASKDPAVQAAAVAALARIDDPAAIAEVGRWATADGDPAVRESAIAALGQSKRREASPYLQQTFASPDASLMMASGRALLELDEADGSAAFTELALNGRSSEVRRYAAVLLLVTRGREHPAVQRLLARNPDPAVREVIEHGLKLEHTHGSE